MKIHAVKQHNSTLLLAPKGKSVSIDVSAFDPISLRNRALIKKEMTGRGAVYFFCWPNNKGNHEPLFALRRYKRGGVISRLIVDSFIYTSLRSTRCYQELRVLEYLHSNKVNVPTPVAALVQRKYLAYRADLITEVIPNATELHEILLQANALGNNEMWMQIGKQIGLMHMANVFHGDINVKNILIQALDNNEIVKPRDKDNASTTNDKPKTSRCKIFLIDFDKCSIRSDGKWKQSNLARLHRSLMKQKLKSPAYNFSDANWQILLNAYNLVLNSQSKGT